MDTSDIERVAEHLLGENAQLAFDEMLQEGDIEKAKIFLLGAVDGCFARGGITFETAADLYKMLDFPPERAAAFRQNLALKQ
jgi:hypothetical protein